MNMIIGERERANLAVRLAQIFCLYIILCFGRSTYRKCFKCFYMTLNLRVCMQYFTTLTSLSQRVCSAVRLCLCQFRFRSDSKRYKSAQHTTTGWRTHKDSTTINYKLIYVTRTSRSMHSFTCGSEGYTPNRTGWVAPARQQCSPSINASMNLSCFMANYVIKHHNTIVIMCYGNVFIVPPRNIHVCCIKMYYSTLCMQVQNLKVESAI